MIRVVRDLPAEDGSLGLFKGLERPGFEHVAQSTLYALTRQE
ncbi:hypothetical protein [Streptomyces umbrinus]|nr:hypothetical protein [Streptomyces umbrinus]